MVATLHISVPLYCYSSAPIDPTLVHILLKNFISDTNTYKIMGINKKINVNTKCKLTIAMTNTYPCTYILHMCTCVKNLNLLQPKLWHVVQFTYQ